MGKNFSYEVGWDQKGLIFSRRHILDQYHGLMGLAMAETVGNDEFVEVGSRFQVGF